jgi:glycosyltransferase involved in cell wall biosynthesis
MERKLYSRIVMLGPAFGSRGAVAALLETYRAAGLFSRWPIDYVAVRDGQALLRSGALAAKGLQRLALLLARNRSVLHLHAAAHRGFWASAAFMALGAAARCPVLLHLHGGGFERFYERASLPGRAAIRACLQRAACVIVPSEHMRSWVRAVSRGAHASIVPCAMPEAQMPGAAARQNLVLFLGELAASKGVFDLVDALVGLRAAVPDAQLIFAGEGARSAIAKYARHLGVADAVKIVGWVGASGKRALLEAAAVYARPSYEDGLPHSLLEAMAAGVPVVAAPVGAITEAITDGVTGVLVVQGDIASLQRHLRALLLDRSLAARIGAAGREAVRLRFAPERALARLEDVYAAAGVSANPAAAPVRDSAMRKAA